MSHALAGARHEQDLRAGGRVQVDVDKGLLVEGVRLFLRQFLAEQKRVERDDAVERPRGYKRLRHGGRHARHRRQVGLADRVGVDDAERFADLREGGRGDQQGKREDEKAFHVVAPSDG